jgi:hypothetical protein
MTIPSFSLWLAEVGSGEFGGEFGSKTKTAIAIAMAIPIAAGIFLSTDFAVKNGSKKSFDVMISLMCSH